MQPPFTRMAAHRSTAAQAQPTISYSASRKRTADATFEPLSLLAYLEEFKISDHSKGKNPAMKARQSHLLKLSQAFNPEPRILKDGPKGPQKTSILQMDDF